MRSREPKKDPFSTQLKALNIDFTQKFQKSALESQIQPFLDQIWPKIDSKRTKKLGKKLTTFWKKSSQKNSQI